jgi:hypothetical protein
MNQLLMTATVLDFGAHKSALAALLSLLETPDLPARKSKEARKIERSSHPEHPVVFFPGIAGGQSTLNTRRNWGTTATCSLENITSALRGFGRQRRRKSR